MNYQEAITASRDRIADLCRAARLNYADVYPIAEPLFAAAQLEFMRHYGETGNANHSRRVVGTAAMMVAESMFGAATLSETVYRTRKNRRY